MRVSDHWLREWVNPALEPQALGERLTMAGLELDSLELAAPEFEGVVVARVETTEPHPDADKLKLCSVSVGEDERIQVVCGAPNVYEGMLAPLARVGAVLPGGLEIKAAKVRGVASAGMLCSAKELGLADTSDGLLELLADAPVGQDLRAYLDLDDAVLEIDLTPNRADCLSILGVARETSVLTDAALKASTVEPIAAATPAQFPVLIEAPQACPRYVGRVIQGIEANATTPMWMQERLRRCGIRSLSPVVDVTNYVLLELGQPMHAFDLAKLSEHIVVRMAEQGEELALLDGRTVSLDADTLVIADDHRPIAMAGIMGGDHTSVTGETVDIFLESAYFAPEAVAGRARRHGLHTESSHRFERGVDPALQARAVERATGLLLDIVGGEPGPIIEVGDPSALPSAPSIPLRADRITRLLGVELPGEHVESILGRLGCEVASSGEGWSVSPPSWRFDLSIEVDLIEELARVHGYDNIPDRARAYCPVIQPQPEARIAPERLRQVLVERGYREAITYSFVDPELEALMAPGLEPLALANPISSELAVMRTSLSTGLLKAIQHNLNRQQTRQRLFETGLTFVPGSEGLAQRQRIAGAVCGAVLPEQWGASSREVDFYDVKADVEALIATGGLNQALEFRQVPRRALHPGQSAQIRLQDHEVGWLGTLHPEIESHLDLGTRVILFELDLEAITRGLVAKFAEISRFPAIRRDLAVVVDEAVTADALRQCVAGAGVAQLREIHVFDIYRGDGVPKGRKSVALGLILQDLSRTLIDEEVEELIQRVISRLASDFGATLRT